MHFLVSLRKNVLLKFDTSEAANNCEGIKLYEETSWVLKNIDITDRKDAIFNRLLGLFLTIFSNCAMIFRSFLLLDISFSCDDDENTKDCFEYKLWNSEAFKTLGRDPIDCNSAAVQNGTLQVVCYRIVFNYGLAAGASYATFQFTMIGLNVATSVMMKVSTKQTVCFIKIISVLLFCGVYSALIAIQATSSHVFFRGSNLVTIIQILTTLASTIVFVFVIPWKYLVTEKNSEYAHIMQNPTQRKRLKRYSTFHSESPQKSHETLL